MKSKGNGSPEQCAANLIMTIRGEIPYERLKGVDPGLIDSPGSLAPSEAWPDIEWLLRTYEPRVQADDIGIEALYPAEGGFRLSIDISNMGAGRFE